MLGSSEEARVGQSVALQPHVCWNHGGVEIGQLWSRTALEGAGPSGHPLQCAKEAEHWHCFAWLSFYSLFPESHIQLPQVTISLQAPGKISHVLVSEAAPIY